MSRKKPSGPREIFLSHSSRDRRLASRLAEMLRRHGLPVWYSDTKIVGAQQWHDEIGEALERCDWFLLLLTPNATRSTWVKRELTYALWDLHYDGRIVPVLARPCDYIKRLSWTLSGFQVIDFTGEFQDASPALLRTWGLAYQPAPRGRRA